MGHADALHLNENLMFDFFKLIINVSDSEICLMNIKRFWFEHKLRSEVSALGSFYKKNLR